ncbi:MAG: hypothetical protein ACR2PL_10855 [Dehalococcoidia bacterium]
MSATLQSTATIADLERLWDLPDGYFFKLRQGDYDPAGAGEVERILQSIKVTEDVMLPRRLISLTWLIPTFMEWQVERVRDSGGNVAALTGDIARLRNALNELLGVP